MPQGVAMSRETQERVRGEPEDFLHSTATGVPPPITVQIETTTRCNLRCIMCPKGSNGEVMEDIDAGILDRIDGLIDHVWEIRAHGFGETFLSRSFEEILQRCARSAASISIVTNGTLLDDRRTRLLVEAGVGTVYVSIDAVDPDLFRTIRRTSLEKIVAGVRRLGAVKAELGSRRPAVVLQMVGMSNNIQDLPAMVRLAASVGAEAVHLVSFTAFDLDAVRTHDLRSLLEVPERARPCIEEARWVAERLGVRLDIAAPYLELLAEVPTSSPSSPPPPPPPPPARSRHERALSLLRRARRALARRRPAPAPPPLPEGRVPRTSPHPRVRCQDPWDAAVIDFKGEVHPCCMSSRAMGSVRDADFETIWDGAPYRDFRRRLLSEEPPEECRSCAKAGWYHPPELEDWIEVGVNDSFGTQLGAGWGAGSDGIRWSRKGALLRLRNSHKPRLRIELVSSPDADSPLEQRGEIAVNGIPVGRFRLDGIVPTPLIFDLPGLEGPELLVRIECEQEHLVAASNGDLWRLGVGLRRAELVS